MLLSLILLCIYYFLFKFADIFYNMDKYLVYLHINKLNKKVYVGITKHDNPELRWRNGYGYAKCIKFYKAI